MKNTLLMLATVAMSAGLASASITYTSPCAVLMFPSTTGNTGSTCSATADAGDYLTSVTITIQDDYTGWQSGTPIVSYSGTLTESAALFTAPTFCNVGTTINAGPPTTGNSIPCAVTINPTGTVTNTLQSLTAFTIQLTNAGNSVSGGTVTGASEVMTITATEAAISLPEPATFGLMGAALVGLGFLARKRKA